MFNKVHRITTRLKNEKNRRDRGSRPARRRVPRPAGKPSAFTIFLAWCVHLYTALGLVIAATIAVLLVQGGPWAFRWSFILMAVATFIDSTDGTLARKIRIKEVIPQFDGRKLDDITDFLTYTFLPLLLICAREPVARAHGVLLVPPAARECLRLLPVRREDR